MATDRPKRLASSKFNPVLPVRCRPDLQGSQQKTSGSQLPSRGRLLVASHPLPVVLSLRFDSPVQDSTSDACSHINRPTMLIQAEDANFHYCWFSRAIDFGKDKGDVAFWMLQKTARDTWLLCLRSVHGEIAIYHVKTRKQSFPIKLEVDRVDKAFKKWPRTVTISSGD